MLYTRPSNGCGDILGPSDNGIIHDQQEPETPDRQLTFFLRYFWYPWTMAKRLDSIDYKILDALQRNARLTNKELAGLVGLAPSTCLERLKRLTTEGIIRGYHADIHPKAFGIGIEAMVILRLRDHSRQALETLRAELMEQKEVVATYYLSGVDDLLVHVAVRDTNHLKDLSIDAFSSRPEVADMQTALIFDYERRFSLPCYSDDEHGGDG